ncbi:uncharacterized protein LOC108912660 [Anoplophora glabripennis]|uniref:uncharacterized protein LOC108912660 n=1 Tax=Anoplophora glabripennis TaxID=217634 RepID=UPI000C7928D3|nr:uncharacterized protein LOC108912660 [Anoplophora glabripennis]
MAYFPNVISMLREESEGPKVVARGSTRHSAATSPYALRSAATRELPSSAHNWEETEKCIFLDLICEEIKIIENKKKLTVLNRDKHAAWERIKCKINVQGYTRDIQRMKEQWQRMKVQAKTAIRRHEKSMCQTGGGPPEPKPSDIDYNIKDLLPHEFTDDYSTFDSDSSVKNHTTAETNFIGIEENVEIDLINNETKDGDFIVNPETGCLEDIYEETIVVSNQIKETKFLKNSLGEPSTPSKHAKAKPMTEYENQLLALNKLRIEQMMKQSAEMHKVKMENKRKYHQERLRMLQINECRCNREN